MKNLTEYWLSKYLIERSKLLANIFGLVGIIVFYKIITYSIQLDSNVWLLLLDNAEGQAMVMIGIMIVSIIISIFLIYSVRIFINRNLSHFFYKKESSTIIRYSNRIQRLKNYINTKNLSIEEVLRYSKIAYGIVLKFNQIAAIEKNWYQKNRKMQEFLKENNQSILNVLIHLRTELRNEITCEKKKIIKARRILQRDVTGNDSLNHITELQSTRLNQQISQFEELQKVLVKK